MTVQQHCRAQTVPAMLGCKTRSLTSPRTRQKAPGAFKLDFFRLDTSAFVEFSIYCPLDVPCFKDIINILNPLRLLFYQPMNESNR